MNPEFRVVIHYWYFRQLKPSEIHREMVIAYKQQTPCMSTITKWVNRFKEGRETLNDDPRCGRPVDISIEAKILQVLDILMILKSTVFYKLAQKMNYQKIDFRWVPHQLSEDNMKKRVEMSLSMLELLESHPNKWVHIATGDEFWIYWFNSHTSQWLLKGSSRPSIPKQVIGSKKTMFCIFFSTHGFLVNKTLPKGQRFNSEFMVNCILPELSDKMFQFRKKMVLKEFMSIWTMLHLTILE